MSLAEPRLEYHARITRNVEGDASNVEEVATVRIQGGNFRHLRHCCIGHPDLFNYLLAESINAAIVVALEELGSRSTTDRQNERVRKRTAFEKAREYYLALHPDPTPVEPATEP